MVQKHVQAVFKNASTGPKNDGNKNLYFQISQTMREHFSENLKYESLRNNFAFFLLHQLLYFAYPLLNVCTPVVCKQYL